MGNGRPFTEGSCDIFCLPLAGSDLFDDLGGIAISYLELLFTKQSALSGEVCHILSIRWW